MKQTYSGGCQCGKVRYEVTADISEVMACNCSRCERLGSLLAFIPRSDFTLKAGKETITLYKFHNHIIEHYFCSTCGIQSYALGKMPDGAEMACINVRCLDNVDLSKLKVTPFDGKRLP